MSILEELRKSKILIVGAGTTGKLDSVAVADIRRFEAELLDFIGREHKEVFNVISETRELSDDTVAKLESIIAKFKQMFNPSVAPVVNEKDAEALDSEGQETITRQVPAKK